MTNAARVVAGVSLLLAGIAAAAAVEASSANRAPAAASQSFSDPAGDATGPASPDITGVTIANDNFGTLTAAVTLANRTQLNEGDHVRVLLDTDLDPLTGCGVEGVPKAEYSVFVIGHTQEPDFYGPLRCVGGQWDLLTPDASLTGSFEPATQTVRFRVNRADFGSPSAVSVWVNANYQPTQDAVPVFDLAPDRPTGHEFVLDPVVTQTATSVTTSTTAQTTTVVGTNPSDRRRPTARALPGAARRGALVRLRYTTADDSGATREELRVRGRTVITLIRRPLAATAAREVHAVAWRVPRRVSAPLRFCVRAWDAAGNASAESCARLRLS